MSRSPDSAEALRRLQVTSFTLGNLNASTNHQSTREIVEAAYDKLHPERALIEGDPRHCLLCRKRYEVLCG